MVRGSVLAAAALVLAMGSTAACSSSSDSGDDSNGELGQSPDEVRETVPGPVVKSTDAEVWSVENAWADTNTPAAKKAGIAWGENSGLSWEEKFRKWVGDFTKVDSPRNGYGQTIMLHNPQGKALMGPVLECADFGMFLRLTFSAFYHLPFYMTGYANGQPMYMGHFGVVDKNGDPISGYPRFKTQYQDFESTWQADQPWPHDAKLRASHVGQDDNEKDVKAGTVTLTENDGAGSYMDELFLNKRVGYLQHYLDGAFGSVNLADGANMFHIKPEATLQGDALLERYGKTGIGHTLPVMTAITLPSGKMRVSVASGSMPRREPNWEEEKTSASYFKEDVMGGVGQSSDDPPVPYAKLGGGIRRWRTPINVNNRWENDVPTVDRPVYIQDSDLDQISARPEKFSQLLAEDTPEGQRDAALAVIDFARRTLHDHPASCSQRSKREDAFKDLYKVMKDSFQTEQAAVDKQYRQLEDYVYAELEYNSSKTCCWNTTTSKMNDIIQDFASQEKDANDKAGVCKQPTVFMASGGGKYDTWKNFAPTAKDWNNQPKYQPGDWKDWHEDEPCAQRDVDADKLGARGSIGMCQQ
jgi:hypothetical protein